MLGMFARGVGFWPTGLLVKMNSLDLTRTIFLHIEFVETLTSAFFLKKWCEEVWIRNLKSHHHNRGVFEAAQVSTIPVAWWELSVGQPQKSSNRFWDCRNRLCRYSLHIRWVFTLNMAKYWASWLFKVWLSTILFSLLVGWFPSLQLAAGFLMLSFLRSLVVSWCTCWWLCHLTPAPRYSNVKKKPSWIWEFAWPWVQGSLSAKCFIMMIVLRCFNMF